MGRTCSPTYRGNVLAHDASRPCPTCRDTATRRPPTRRCRGTSPPAIQRLILDHPRRKFGVAKKFGSPCSCPSWCVRSRRPTASTSRRRHRPSPGTCSGYCQGRRTGGAHPASAGSPQPHRRWRRGSGPPTARRSQRRRLKMRRRLATRVHATRERIRIVHPTPVQHFERLYGCLFSPSKW